MIKVLLADDHTIVRHGLKQIIDTDSEMTVVGEAASGSEVMEFVKKTPVDVIVLDISMSGRNGLETLKDLKREYPAISVLILSMHSKDQYAVRVIKAGAFGYLSKEDAPEELVNAIKKAFRGEKYISPEVAELLADYIEHGLSDTPHTLLSDREYEVFREIGRGKSITQISTELALSVKTVSTYKTRIIEKTGMATNAEITRYCIEYNLV